MSHTNIQSSDVRKTLARHILADGYDMVLDLEKSHRSYLIDKITKREYLDFFTFFASNPLGMNHPALVNDDFIRRIGKAAINKPSNSDIEILTIEGGYYAVIEYSGRSSDKNFLKNKDILEKLLKQDNITILSPPIRASYNSPFTLPMLKRNEVMYRIDL